MLLALLLLALTTARAFNITCFHVPALVPEDQEYVDIDCKYNATFTIVQWFHGSTEFFRYKPTSVPSLRSFPTPGVGSVDVISCGLTECRLRLGQLTEQASGLYSCDLEYAKPPFKFATRKGFMKVSRPQPRAPVVDGLAKEYYEDQDIQAYCRTSSKADIRWHINGKEITDFRGERTLKMPISQLPNPLGTLPTIIVQCAEHVDGKLALSNDAFSKVKYTNNNVNNSSKKSCLTENSSNALNGYTRTLFLLFVCVIYL